MGKPKKYHVRSINFGEAGNPARILIEKFIQIKGKKALSSLIRKWTIIHLKDEPEYQDWKTQQLLYERKELGAEIAEKAEKRSKINQQLRELGTDPDEVIY